VEANVESLNQLFDVSQAWETILSGASLDSEPQP
jgi:hypothetical protein